MSPKTTAPLTRLISIDLIDEPEIIMRESMSDEGLVSLADSMRELGQLQAIGVVQIGRRYRVIWGHRRRVVAARAGLRELECKVFPEGTSDVEARKVAENDEQETVNVVSEATYYQQLFEKVCGRDVDRVAALVRKPLSRVLDRLDLLRGDATVLQALREGRISIAVANVLNQCPHEGYRSDFLHQAIRDGATARTVRSWVDDVKRMLRNQTNAAEAGIETPPMPAIAPIMSMDACCL
jgi:ParB/RepB/Spo0J family partition protein